MKHFEWDPIEIERRTGAIKQNPIYECLWYLYCNKGPKAMLFSDLIACVTLKLSMAGLSHLAS
jgi:hypothetical protein